MQTYVYVCSICPYFFGYKHDIDDYPPARTKVEHSFTHVHTKWSTKGPFHTGQICCRAPFLGFSAWISGAGGFPTIVVFGGGFEARVILSLPEVWDTTSVALRKQPKSRHFSEATRHSFMLMIYCFPLPKHPQIIILKIKKQENATKTYKNLGSRPLSTPPPRAVPTSAKLGLLPPPWRGDQAGAQWLDARRASHHSCEGKHWCDMLW